MSEPKRVRGLSKHKDTLEQGVEAREGVRGLPMWGGGRLSSMMEVRVQAGQGGHPLGSGEGRGTLNHQSRHCDPRKARCGQTASIHMGSGRKGQCA